MGVMVGLVLSKLIDITSFGHLLPTFLFLTVLNVYTSYNSAKVIDENHLNNQRSYLLFNTYFDEKEPAKISSVPEINNQEFFYSPNLLNPNYCHFIKYG